MDKQDTTKPAFVIEPESGLIKDLYTISNNEMSCAVYYMHPTRMLIVNSDLKSDHYAACSTYVMNADNIFELKAIAVSQGRISAFSAHSESVFDNDLKDKVLHMEFLDNNPHAVMAASHALNDDMVRHILLGLKIHSDDISPVRFELFGVDQILKEKAATYNNPAP